MYVALLEVLAGRVFAHKSENNEKDAANHQNSHHHVAHNGRAACRGSYKEHERAKDVEKASASCCLKEQEILDDKIEVKEREHDEQAEESEGYEQLTFGKSKSQAEAQWLIRPSSLK